MQVKGIPQTKCKAYKININQEGCRKKNTEEDYIVEILKIKIDCCVSMVTLLVQLQHVKFNVTNQYLTQGAARAT